MVFRLSFSFRNLIFLFCLCNCFGISSSAICVVFWSNRIISRKYLLSICDICSVSAIWYFVFRCFYILVFFFLLIIATKRDDSLQSVSVRLDIKNYSYWSYLMRNFLKGKKMWGYVSGPYVIPKNT